MFNIDESTQIEYDKNVVCLVFKDTEESTFLVKGKQFKKFLNDLQISFISYRPQSFMISKASYEIIKG